MADLKTSPNFSENLRKFYTAILKLYKKLQQYLFFFLHVHRNLHHKIEVRVIVDNPAQFCAAAAVASLRSGFTRVVQVTYIADVVSDKHHLLSVQVYMNGCHQLYDGSLPTSLSRR